MERPRNGKAPIINSTAHPQRSPAPAAPINGDGFGVVYMECGRNIVAPVGGYLNDGCEKFVAKASAAAQGVDHAQFLCANCGCHRSFHRMVCMPRPPPPRVRPLNCACCGVMHPPLPFPLPMQQQQQQPQQQRQQQPQQQRQQQPQRQRQRRQPQQQRQQQQQLQQGQQQQPASAVALALWMMMQPPAILPAGPNDINLAEGQGSTGSPGGSEKKFADNDCESGDESISPS